MSRLRWKKPSEIRGSPEYGKRLEWKPGYGPLTAKIPKKPETGRNIVPTASKLSPAEVADKMKSANGKSPVEILEKLCIAISEPVMSKAIGDLGLTEKECSDALIALKDAAEEGVDISPALDAIKDLQSDHDFAFTASWALALYYFNEKEWQDLKNMLYDEKSEISKPAAWTLRIKAQNNEDIRPMFPIMMVKLTDNYLYQEISDAFRYSICNEETRHTAVNFLIGFTRNHDKDLVERVLNVLNDSIGRNRNVAMFIDAAITDFASRNYNAWDRKTKSMVSIILRNCDDVIRCKA